jgi:hypothetical protein
MPEGFSAKCKTSGWIRLRAFTEEDYRKIISELP